MLLNSTGKTGVRDIVLSDKTILHLRELSKGKLPGALLHVPRDRDEWGKSEQARRIKTAVAVANKTFRNPLDKIPELTVFYFLRHTHVSLALIGGVNIQVLAENLGTSIRMIEIHYGKFSISDRKAMFNAVSLP